MKVIAGDEHNLFSDDAKEQAVRKTADQGAAGVSMDHRVRPRSACNSLHCRSNGAQKLLAQPWTLHFVPAVGRPEI